VVSIPTETLSGVDPQTARELFDLPDDVTFLNCANIGPQMRSVTEAGMSAVAMKAHPWRISSDTWFSAPEELRKLAAQLLNVEAEGMALVPAASYGIAVAAANVKVKEGQSIVLLDREFPSNFYSWKELARLRAGRLVIVKCESGESWTDALLRAIDENTAVVSIPNCHWSDGGFVDLISVSEKVRQVGAALVVDASQSLGVCPLDLGRVRPDFLVSVGYKWLLGPYGLSYLYVAPPWREHGRPIEESWLTRLGCEDFTKLVDYSDQYRPGARRFDMGEFPQFVLVPMAAAALRQMLLWDVATIQQSLSVLVDRIAQKAIAAGYSVLPADQRSNHLIGVRLPQGIPPGLSTALAAEKVYVSLRGDAIRIAPHVYNDSSDVDRLFEVLNAYLNR